MGFFSSIGSVLGGAVGSVFGPVGTVIGAGLGNAAGSALGGSSSSDKRYDQQMSFAQSQDQFSRDYVQNAIQWRVEDAKKAGVHPMAALGISSPQYSAASLPSIPSDTQSIDPMEFGQSLNYAATKAKGSKEQETMIGLQIRGMELDNEYKKAQIDQMKVDTLASSIASNQALHSPSAPSVNAKSPLNTGLRSPEGSAYHVWDMGNGNFDILMNPNYQQTIGDEFGQVATTLKAVTRAKQGVWLNPEDGRAYVYNPDSGYFNLLSALHPEEADRLLGGGSSGSAGASSPSSHRERNRYRYRY